MHFEILGEVEGVETIASGRGIRDLPKLIKRFGRGNWRKMKGSRKFGCAMEQSPEPKYTGTKRTASAGAG